MDLQDALPDCEISSNGIEQKKKREHDIQFLLSCDDKVIY